MSETPPFSPTVALLTVTAAWQAAFAEALKPVGLTSRTYALLGHIRAMPGLSFSELARRSRITAPSAHVAVAGLKKDGLVEDDTERAGAASHLRVTRAGDRLLADAGARIAALDAEFAAKHPSLTEALRAHVADLMRAPR
ncbi:MarR family winged helix-turn-helix transcriptional regulator [Microbacterium galbinum]|uniref:MarR family transcriptional regulator n=1 Tax=Microbacterium galbinum TaxID=2851646 RepID=A0ABY4IR02_9MICO|nr:helix-turn-helix domain-containing protein [Microbacterium galbinum]UPL14075.1 MarR family transcriptional regulator [Microbacterium galbinum]